METKETQAEEEQQVPYEESLRKRGIKAAHKFLERRGYDLVRDIDDEQFDSIWKQEDEDCLVFVKTLVRDSAEEGFPRETFNQTKAEKCAIKWIKELDNADDCTVRFDEISILVLNENSDKAFLRHHVNVTRSDW